MQEKDIPELDLFMMCEKPDVSAYRPLPDGYTIRNITQKDLPAWRAFPFDTAELAAEYDDFMRDFYQKTYAHNEQEFFNRTYFACDDAGRPVATCGSWKAYGQFESIHWLKTLKSHEGLGIGKALFTMVMERFAENDYPVFLHTHPSGFRAVKLYADFGFKLLSGDKIGNRNNDLEECLPILEEFMPDSDFSRLEIAKPTQSFLNMLENEGYNQF